MNALSQFGPCVVCGVLTDLTCSVCLKEFYCRMEHQQSHRRLHKQDCFPAQLLHKETYGRYFVATRDIRPGEIIFTEKAIVHSPSGRRLGTSNFLPICLGCCKVIRPESICPGCVWPLCGKDCPMISFHTKMECSILSKNSVIPSGKLEEYEFIKIIRVLLLEDSDPYKWNKFMSLESHATAIEKSSDFQNFASAVEFIQGSCNLQKFPIHQIKCAYGICKVNSYSTIRDRRVSLNKVRRFESGIYYNTSKLAHDCIPNCRLIVMEVTKPHAAFTIRVMAAVPIKHGEILAYSYVDNNYPTMERQYLLRENYYFTCYCKRCLDPTELGTNFNGIKCPNRNCHGGGYLLPTSPLIPYADWRCTACHYVRNFSEFGIFLDVLKKVIDDAASEMNTTAASSSKYERILLENQGVTLYTGHHAMYNSSCEMLSKIVDSLSTVNNNDFLLLKHISQKIIFYSKRCLRVADIFNPGLNVTRGKILYYMARGMRKYNFLTANLLRNDDPIKIMQEIEMEYIVQAAKDILFMEPEGSDERLMAETLAQQPP